MSNGFPSAIQPGDDDIEQRSKEKRCCSSFSLDGISEVKGSNYGGIARGAISMSNVYLANCIIHWACKASGGFDEEGLRCINPNLFIYGMKPGAIISTIAVVSSLVSALIMPLVGAIIDYTPHRKKLGIWTSVAMTVITGVQIATLESSWPYMAILQIIIFVIYQIQVMVLFAYYPEIARDQGESKMNWYSSTWSACQFTSQAVVNIIILATTKLANFGTVHASMVSQGVTMLFCIVFLTWCWTLMPTRPRKHRLPEGHSLLVAGFRQNYNTCILIWKHYKTGLRWFLISTVFGDASASAVGTTAVVFLNGNLKLTAFQIGFFFECSLVGVVFGTKIGAMVTNYSNPKISLILSELGLALSVVIGVWAVQGVVVKELTYMWGFSIGIFLGWFYPAENIFFSLCVPKNQETELSGFYGQSSQVLGWFPPLVFTIMVQSNISLAWALTVVASIFLISVFFLCMCGPWEKIIEEANLVDIDFAPISEGFTLAAAVGNEGKSKNAEDTETETGKSQI